MSKTRLKMTCTTPGCSEDFIGGEVGIQVNVGEAPPPVRWCKKHAPASDGRTSGAGGPVIIRDPARIYIAGAHSTGKSTLARWISKTYALPLVTEVARAVLAEHELSLDTLRTDIERTAAFQAEVFKRQAIAEDTVGSRFVSDRAFDNLAYAAAHTIKLYRIMKEVPGYVERLKLPQSVVFFVRPQPAIMKDDGVRERMDWEEIVRIDGMIRLLFEEHDIDFIPIASLSMAERARAVRGVLRLMNLHPVSQ